MEKLDYEEDVRINESALDVEWLNQPALAMKYGRYYADCFKKLQEAEEHIQLVKAQLINRANEDSENCLGKGVKPTAVNVEQYYRQHENHIDAKRDVIDAQYELNIATAAKNEISFSRKTALENLVKLHGQNYFAGPSVPRDLSYEYGQSQLQEKTNIGIATRLKRKH